MDRFGNPQACAIAGGQDRTMLDAVETLEKPSNFIDAEDNGQLSRLLKKSLAFGDES